VREIHTEIEIAASAERVWQVLTDFPAYPAWNTVMHILKGELQAGNRLKVQVRPWPGVTVSFQAIVLHVEPERELRWQGVLLLARLFKGEHSFLLEPLGRDRARFVQREVYSGLLAPLLLLILTGRNRRAFEEMNRALKARAEQI
jgi:hypothetical protein